MHFKLLLLLATLHESVSLMCYICSDSSNEKGKNRCQTWVRTMRRQKLDFQTTPGDIDKYQYVKNCTGFGDAGADVYCAITSVQLGGGMRSFIRDCSDGKHFFGADYNDEFLTGNVLPDNQTTCRYNGQGYLACVTLCGGSKYFDENERDFCNGPSSAGYARASMLLSAAAVLLFILFRNIVS